MLFVNIEGADAVGKNTQTKRLIDKLRAAGADAKLYSFPRYETPTGQAILRHLKKRTALMERRDRGSSDHTIDGDSSHVLSGDDPLAFQGMMLIDKCDAAFTMRGDLEEGTVLVTDRWWQSAWTYGGADGLSEQTLYCMHQLLPQANMNILLDLDPKVALERRPKARDRYEEDRLKMERVRERYRNFWTAEDPTTHVILDASGSSDEIAAEIWERTVQAARSIGGFAFEDGAMYVAAVVMDEGTIDFHRWNSRDDAEDGQDPIGEMRVSLAEAVEWAHTVRDTLRGRRGIESRFSIIMGDALEGFMLADSMSFASKAADELSKRILVMGLK